MNRSKQVTSVILLALLLIASSLVVETVAAKKTTTVTLTTACDQKVTIYFFNVGDADSMLIITPTKIVLIDGGTDGDKLLEYLDTYSVTKIDLLFATHCHKDHMGGLVTLLESKTITIKDVVYNGYNYTSDICQSFLTLASNYNLTTAVRGQVYSLSPSINFTVLNPTQPLEFDDLNANSIALRLQVGNTSVLFAGDTLAESEESMLKSGLTLQSQVLKVGHHGRDDSTSEEFLDAVDPAIAVISADEADDAVLDRLDAKGASTYTTYDNGTIILSLQSSPTSSGASSTPTAPEYPTLMLMPMLLAAILATALLYKKQFKPSLYA